MHPREPELNEADVDARIARALQRLPDPEPPRDGWAALERRLAQPPPWRGWVPTAAVAASALVVALGLVLRSAGPGGLADPSRTTAHVEPRTPLGTPLDVDDGAPRSVAEWRARSVELERLLAEVPEPSVTRASTGATTALLEDRIAAIDDQLSDVSAGRLPAAEADPLWRQRALLLDSLVRVRYAAAVDPGT